VPHYETLPASLFEGAQPHPGIDLAPERSRALLREMAAYGAECRWPEAAGAPGTYYASNDNFGFSSAAPLHALIRHFRPRRVVEVGGGYSSLISLAALRANGGDWRFTCIEPYPFDWLRRAIAAEQSHAALVDAPVQKADPALFDALQANDILFIDSSHVATAGSDVNCLFHQVLPRLAPGVLVHVHDIYLPYEYPAVHFFGESKLFWNEQYLLQAFLAGNQAFEVLLPVFHVQSTQEADYRAAFPHYDSARHRKSSSFWMRRK
jgi:hypothetical protein